MGIGNSSEKYFDEIDWTALEELAAEQGLSAVLVDGVEKLPDDKRPPKMVLLQWIGETLQGYEYRYEQYRKAIAEMTAFYKEHGFKMMVLKGYACALDWPKPEHRPCGDIDIWQFGQQKAADAALAASSMFQDSGSKIDYGHNVHTVFDWGDFMVENHYEFFDHKRYRSLSKLEQILEEMADDSHSVEINGEKVYVPSPNLHALFLIIHALNHFASIGINLRQLLDWAFFVKAHTKEIDWEWLNELMEEYHMKDFVGCLNAICVENLGFDANIFNSVQFNPTLKDRVLQDILNPEYNNDLPKNLIKRVIYKWKRWKANGWKYELCYNESRTSAFWHGVWNHLLKPKSI